MESKPSVPPLRFSGIQPFTLLDYPGHVACILFLPGCNFRCGYCHNPEFVLPEELVKTRDSWVGEEDVMRFLERRRGKLDGVVISGGEPTMHPGLESFIRRVKAAGFNVKLDTNGGKPDMIAKLLDERLLDYVAMDVKTSLARYPELVGPCVKPEAIQESMRLIKSRAPEYEFRTTLIRELHDPYTITQLSELISDAKRYRLQTYRPSVTLNPDFRSFHPFSAQEMRDLSLLFSYVQDLHIDGTPVRA